MSSEERKRADLGFGSTFEELDAAEWVAGPKPQREKGVDAEIVKSVAEKSGFQSREGAKSAVLKKQVILRMQKNFRPRIEHCEKFDFLVGSKITGKEGPELIDEALELLFGRYEQDMKFFEALKQRKLPLGAE